MVLEIIPLAIGKLNWIINIDQKWIPIYPHKRMPDTDCTRKQFKRWRHE